MAPAIDAIHGVRASLLVLAVAAAVTVISVPAIRGGFPGEAWRVATIELDQDHVELSSVVQPGADVAALNDETESAATSARFAVSPAPAAKPPRERFMAEAGGQAHVGTSSTMRGSDQSDARVHLLEATTQRWVREGRPYAGARSMCEAFSDRGDWRFAPPICSGDER